MSASEFPIKLFRVREVAKVIDTHPNTVRSMIRRGQLRAVRLGRILRVTGEERERFVSGGGKVA